jgi:hypothetical protein
MGDLLKAMEDWLGDEKPLDFLARQAQELNMGYGKKLDIQLTDKENDFRLFVEDTLRRSGAIPDYTSIAMTIQLMRGYEPSDNNS